MKSPLPIPEPICNTTPPDYLPLSLDTAAVVSSRYWNLCGVCKVTHFRTGSLGEDAALCGCDPLP
ncbi:hypothetical protein BaRGS_00015249, partial [Batillaria attramentaria]